MLHRHTGPVGEVTSTALPEVALDRDGKPTMAGHPGRRSSTSMFSSKAARP